MQRRGESADFRLGGLQKFRRGIHPDQAPLIEQGDPRAQEQGFPHVMRDEDNRFSQTQRQRPKLSLQVGARNRIERAKRLVHEQDWRVRGKRPRYPHALLLAAGKLGRAAFGELLRRQANQRSISLTRAWIFSSGHVPAGAQGRHSAPRSSAGISPAS